MVIQLLSKCGKCSSTMSLSTTTAHISEQTAKLKDMKISYEEESCNCVQSLKVT